MTEGTRKRREEWRPILDAEVERWSAMSYERLATELAEEQVCEVERNGKDYQVEVNLLEDTDKYMHVLVAVDDGSLPASLSPLSASFIREKSSGTPQTNSERLTTSDQRPLS
jgi:hypothetical protein